MKQILIIIFILFQSIYSFSQKTIKIGLFEERVYPFDLKQIDFSYNWINSINNFNNIEIFGMGEATHGTHEFFDIKSKTFKYLATNFNYKVFAIEGYFGECCYINDYVISGVGNIDSVMLNFSWWAWRTKEIKNLIFWIKEFNKQKPDSEKIKFYGFDMQDIYSPLKYFVHYFKSDTSNLFEEVKSITNPVLLKSKDQIFTLFNSKNHSFRDTLDMIYNRLNKWIEENESFLKKRFSNIQIECIKMCIGIYDQAIKYKYNSEYRDSCMAKNIMKIHNIEKGKMFIWAHNAHINKVESPTFSRLGKSMGDYLNKAFGSKYYALGFVFNQGNFQAKKFSKTRSKSGKTNPKLKEFTVPEYKRNTFTEALSSANLDAFFIDIGNSNNPLFNSIKYTYHIGSFFRGKKRSSVMINAKKQYDGLIYIRNITRAIPLSK